MKPIGGYFELADREQGVFIHQQGVLLNTGRNALEWILLSLDRVDKVYLPSYTCDVVFEPLKRLGVPWQFYRINEKLEIDEEVNLYQNEYIIVNNYFGLKDAYIEQTAVKYGSKIIVDCAQAFFAPVLSIVKMFYSPRKFVGVADGGIAYGVNRTAVTLFEYDSSKNSQHLYIRKMHGAEAGFPKYREDEELLGNQHPLRMSSFTKDILEHIDYHSIISRRKKNYLILEKELGRYNLLSLPPMDSFCAPMVYPLMVNNGKSLRMRLIENKVFVPCFWPNEIIPTAYCGVNNLSEDILPLPLDQRYGEEEMNYIVTKIKENA